MIALRPPALAGLALVLGLPLFASAALAQQVQGPDDPNRPPLLSAPAKPAPAATGDAAKRPAAQGQDQQVPTTSFFDDYPPEVVPPSSTRRDVTIEGSSAVK